MNSHPVLICGTRSFAVEVADLVSEIPGLEVSGFVENLDRDRCREPIDGLAVHWIDDVAELAATHLALCALVTTERSRFTDEMIQRGAGFATAVHPTARVSPRSDLGEGTIVSTGVMVGACTTVGRHVILNRGALVGHHSEIGDHASILPGANVAGNCRIGNAVSVGMGAIVLDNREVGEGAVIGAGSVVTRDVEPGAKVVGVPARPVTGRGRR